MGGNILEKQEILKKIKGKLIVSCQALEEEPLHSDFIMSKMALAADMAGAGGIRANTVVDINAISKETDLPIIGIIKRVYSNSDVYITPTILEVDELIKSNASIIAFDGTLRKRPNNSSIRDIIDKIHLSEKIAMADISTYEEGINAHRMGADIISTTLSGYTPYTSLNNGPNFELIKKLSKEVPIPVIAEGMIEKPEDAVECLKLGAFAIVVGGAITRPQLIAKKFVDAINKMGKI